MGTRQLSVRKHYTNPAHRHAVETYLEKHGPQARARRVLERAVALCDAYCLYEPFKAHTHGSYPGIEEILRNPALVLPCGVTYEFVLDEYRGQQELTKRFVDNCEDVRDEFNPSTPFDFDDHSAWWMDNSYTLAGTCDCCGDPVPNNQILCLDCLR